MANTRFIIDNKIDTSSLVADPIALADYPIDNVKRINRSQVYRSSTNLEQDIDITFDSPSSISSVVLGRHNFSTEVKYRIYLYSAGMVQEYDSGLLQVQDYQAASDFWEWGEFEWGSITWGEDKIDDQIIYNLVHWMATTYNDITNATIHFEMEYDPGGAQGFYCDNEVVYCDNEIFYCNAIFYGGEAGSYATIPYYEIGRLIMGDYSEPTYNLSYGHTLAWLENTTQYRTNGGTLLSDVSTSNKEISFDLRTIPESDRITLHKELVQLGLSKDFFISIFPEEANLIKQRDYSGIVKFTRVPKYNQILCNYYRSSFVVEEV